MADWQPLSKTKYAEMHYRPRYDYAHARERSLVPAMLGELTRLIPHYMIAFMKEKSVYRPMVVLAAPNQANLFLKANDQWAAPYVPASLRAYPFSLLHTKGGEGATLAVDTDSLRDEDRGERLFDDQGAMTEGVQRAFDFLSKMEGQRQRTEKAADLLQAAAVIEPWPLSLPINHENVTIKGLYRVDEQALNSLDATAYATLQGAPMQLAYAQLYSMAQAEVLAQRAEQHAKMANAHTPDNLDAVFGEGEDDDFIFDFDS